MRKLRCMLISNHVGLLDTPMRRFIPIKLPDRKITSYRTTKTPSLGPLPFSKKNASLLTWIHIYRHHIEYHATWRVRLYFLMLVLYHNSKRFITIGRTCKQHGVGIAKYELDACHSSLFPRVIDYSPDNTVEFLSQKQQSIFDGTAFDDMNNMTVCAPKTVNLVDCYLEDRMHGRTYRKRLLAILNQVSIGNLTPEQGMHFFFLVMQRAFIEMRRVAAKVKGPKKRDALLKVIAHQERGTFENATESLHLSTPFFKKTLHQKNEPAYTAYDRTRKELLKNKYRPADDGAIHDPKNGA